MVCLDTPTSRATSSAFRPASTCFNAAMMSASVCLPLDMLLPLSDLRNHIQFRADLGEQVRLGSTWFSLTGLIANPSPGETQVSSSSRSVHRDAILAMAEAGSLRW